MPEAESAFLTTDVTDITDARGSGMLGDQGTIRAIRVICGETIRKIGRKEAQKSQKRKRGD
jgi:hypothetical protein